MPPSRKSQLAKFFALALVIIIGAICAGITLTFGWRPIIGAKARQLTPGKFESSPARLARGKYLVEGVTGCFGCHSPTDVEQPGYPPVQGKEGEGVSWAGSGLPWLYAPNITPDNETGAGTWTDDMFARAIREGIGHDGRALFPVMPYSDFRSMSDEDLASIIVYVRSVPAIKNPGPQTKIPFPLSRLILGAPQPIDSPAPAPDLSTPERRGAYLVSLGACTDCHTPQQNGQPIPGMDFAGGFTLQTPAGPVASANITPDPSGVSYYDEGLFVNVMRTGHVRSRQLNSIMPWYFFKNMTDEDLKSIFAFLKTVKPVQHRVDNTEVSAACKKCRGSHGLGASN